MLDENEVIDSAIEENQEEGTSQIAEQQSEVDKSDNTNDAEYWKKEALTYKGKFEHLKSKGSQSASKSKSNQEDRLDVLEFSISHKDLDREDIETIYDLSKSKGIKLEDAFNLPIVQNNLKYKSEEQKKKDANVTSSRSPRYVANNVEFKKDMTAEEHKKAWEEAMRNQQ